MPADASWTFAPGPLLAVALALVVYATRWSRARAEEGPRAASVWRLISFCTGLAMALAALVSPVDALSHQLASMHMVQHILLLDLASIFVILGFTKVILRPVTRRVQRLEQAAGPLAHPVFAVILYATVLWVWHVPWLYDLALEHPGWHAVEHVSFTAAGALYWWHLLSPIRSRMRLDGMGPVAYMVSTKLLVGFLGIGLTFDPNVLYAYGDGPRAWGLTPHGDQAVAGVIMATEQSIVMGVVLVWLFIRMLSESERAQQREERLEAAS